MKKIAIYIISLCLVVSFINASVIAKSDAMGCFHGDENGYDTWLSGQNPYVREMYGGYEREGNFLLYNDTTKEVFSAKKIQCYWKSGGGVGQKYLLEDDTWIEKTGSLTSREYVETVGDFVLLRECSGYSEPFFDKAFQIGEKLAPGTYKVLKFSVDYVQLLKADGTAVWVVPQYNDDDTFNATSQGYFVESITALSTDTIQGVPIKQMMMPVREDKRTGIAMQPKYVTIHNTGNEGTGANAYVHAYNQIYDSRSYISWHYTVDNNEIYQSMPLNEIGFHAGDGLNIGNGATIGIEICENVDGNYAQAERNAAYLTAHILYENNLPSDAVRMHKDWSGKNCAQNIIEGSEGTMGWDAFKALVKQEYDRLVEENKQTENPDIPDEEDNPDEIVYLKGDVNGDGYISSKDYNAIKNHITGSKILVDNILKRADVNGDGYISSKDYNAIKNHITGNKKLF